MAKIKDKKASMASLKEKEIQTQKTKANTEKKNYWKSQGFYFFICSLIFGLILYANTFKHGYALDDEIVICQNEYVLKGTAALPQILTEDAFSSFFRQQNVSDQNYAGRYRPLSYVSYAIEQEFIQTYADGKIPADCWDKNGNKTGDPQEDLNEDGIYTDKDCKTAGMPMRHVVNVLLYILCLNILFYLLNTFLFKENKIMVWFSCLLFLFHPIHTEIVDNVKSRDEILSMIFILLTLIYSFKYFYSRKIKDVLFSSFFFFLAFLSKEYAVMLLVLVPISLYLFTEGDDWKKIKKLYLGQFISFAIYMLILYSITNKMTDELGTELLNNPYLPATVSETLATKIYCLLKYIYLLIWPHPLCSDYSFSSIAYRNFASWDFWLSLLLYIFLIGLAIYQLKKRNKWIYGLILFLGFLFPVSNLAFKLPLTISERLIFHASLGFCIMLAGAIYFVLKKIKQANLKTALISVSALLVVYAFLVIQRNPAWKNDSSLALTDIKTHPNSLLLLSNACSRTIDQSENPANANKIRAICEEAKSYGLKAVKMHPTFSNAYINLGLAYGKMGDADSAAICFDLVKKYNPSNPNHAMYNQYLASLFKEKAYKFANEKKWKEGWEQLEKAVLYAPNDARMWYDLGGFSYNSGSITRATEAWKKALALAPNDKEIRAVNGLK